jgi:hypothetical protein
MRPGPLTGRRRAKTAHETSRTNPQREASARREAVLKERKATIGSYR